MTKPVRGQHAPYTGMPSRSEANRSSPEKLVTANASAAMERGFACDHAQCEAAHLLANAPADEKFFTVDEVAEILNVCTRTVRRWIERKKLIAHDLEGIIRIAESNLRNFIARRRL